MLSAPAPEPDNYLLQLLEPEARAALSLVSVELGARDVLQEPGAPVLFAYFPVSAVISLVSTMENGAAAEVAIVGREGLVGLAGVLGHVESPTTGVVQVPGLAFKTATVVLKRARLRFASVRTVLDRYTRARLIQVGQTAACNRLHSVEARLARWLLAIDERIGSRPFTLPQEFMAQMLGVQRPTVSTTMHRLQDSKIIAYRGRAVLVADRAKLERLACECHGVLRREFEGLRHSAVGGADRLAPSSIGSTLPDGQVEAAAALETMRQIAGRLLVATIQEQEARQEAEAASRAKDEFLAMVSHELRTPLNAILGWCSMLSGWRDGPSIEHGLQVIQQNANAQLKLVEDLLDASRLASSRLVLNREMVDLADIVRRAVDTVQPIADRRQIAINVRIDGAGVAMLGDANRLGQVFLNVMMNAVKFTDPGGSVDVSSRTIDGTQQMIVRDNGRGIPAALLPHVFERFQQGTLAPADLHGLGLGLAIARDLVELHRGTIQIDSPGDGRGTTCTISLPLPDAPFPAGEYVGPATATAGVPEA